MAERESALAKAVPGRSTRRRMLAAGGAAALLAVWEGRERVGTPASGEQRGISRRLFWVGQAPYQMYVDAQYPAGAAGRATGAIFVHGASGNGSIWENTPDGREGWAPIFLRSGYSVYAVDLPGHGRSPLPPDFATIGLDKAVAGIHALLREAGPSVLVGHSLGGAPVVRAVGGAAADVRALIRAVVLVAPAAVSELITAPGPMFTANEACGISFTPEQYGPAVTNAPNFPREAFQQYVLSQQVESPISINELFQPGLAAPAGGPAIFSGIPTLLVAGEHDISLPLALYGAYGDYFGIPVVMLGRDWNLTGFGHFPHIERGNEEVAASVLRWLRDAGVAP